MYHIKDKLQRLTMSLDQLLQHLAISYDGIIEVVQGERNSRLKDLFNIYLLPNP